MGRIWTAWFRRSVDIDDRGAGNRVREREGVVERQILFHPDEVPVPIVEIRDLRGRHHQIAHRDPVTLFTNGPGTSGIAQSRDAVDVADGSLQLRKRLPGLEKIVCIIDAVYDGVRYLRLELDDKRRPRT